MLEVIGLFFNASTVRTGAGMTGSRGGVVAREGGVEGEGSSLEMSAMSAAARSLRVANARKDWNIRLWIPRLGSLWSLWLFEGITGAVEAQQKMGSGRDIVSGIILWGLVWRFGNE